MTVATANGFAGTIANPTTTPAITISTTVTADVLKGDGTAISAATVGVDYTDGTGSLANGMLYNTTTTGVGVLSIAVEGSTYSKGTATLITGMLKSTTATGALSIGVANEDYKGILDAEIEVPASGNLTIAQVANTIITNYGQAATAGDPPMATNIIAQLPTAGAGMKFIAMIGTDLTAEPTATWGITADTSDLIYLDGVAGADNGTVYTNPVLGSCIRFVSIKTGATSWDWLAFTDQGTWTAV